MSIVNPAFWWNWLINSIWLRDYIIKNRIDLCDWISDFPTLVSYSGWDRRFMTRIYSCWYSCLMEKRYCTGWLDRMSHRKWKEIKQQLIWWPDLGLLGCCLVSLRFLSNILSSRVIRLFSLSVNNYWTSVLRESTPRPPRERFYVRNEVHDGNQAHTITA